MWIFRIRKAHINNVLAPKASSYPSNSLLSWSQKAWMLLQSVSLLSGFVALSEMGYEIK